MSGIRISGIEYYLPAQRLTNEELSRRFGTPESDIYKKTGIRTRYHTTRDFIMVDMAAQAGREILKKFDRNSIDGLVLVGHGFSYKAPNTSVILQHRLELPTQLLSIDLPHGCTGYLNGLAISSAMLKGGLAKKVLLVTGDTPSYVINSRNEELLSIFSDSASASVVESAEGGDPDFVFGTDGSGAESLIVRQSGTADVISDAWMKESGLDCGEMEMKSTEIFLFAIRTVPKLISETLEKNKLTPDDIDLYVFHQANGFLLETLRKKIKIPAEKFVNDIEHTGNTVSSSIPIALKNAEASGRLKRGMKVLLAGFGIGYTWGATVITY